MKTGKSFIKRNIEWLILAIVMLCMHVLYLFLIGHPEGDLIYVEYWICALLRLRYALRIFVMIGKCGI